MNWLGNQISRFTEFSLLEQQFGSFSSFVSVLNHSELVFYLICFFGSLTLRGRFSKNFRVSLNQLNWLGNRISQFIGFNFPEWKFGYFVLFVLVLSHSMSELHTICIFWFPYSVRNVLKKFQNCSQPDRPVWELDQPVFRVL